jgi:integrase
VQRTEADGARADTRDVPKSRAGIRCVPIIGALRDALTEHRALTGRTDGLVFGRTDSVPFNPTTINGRARRAWKAAKLQPLGLHECRQTSVSYSSVRGLSMKAISAYPGHASVAFTLDRYARLLPGSKAEAVQTIDAFMARADTAARLAALDG